jgi:hypothetical protein
MTIRVAINGYGRIGRMVLRALYEDQVNGKTRRDIKIVAINAMGDIDINAHLTQYDSAHGRFPAEVKVDGDCMVVNGDRIKMYSTRNPLETPWGEHQVDLVLECSGKFTSKEKALVHIQQGAKKVLRRTELIDGKLYKKGMSTLLKQFDIKINLHELIKDPENILQNNFKISYNGAQKMHINHWLSLHPKKLLEKTKLLINS